MHHHMAKSLNFVLLVDLPLIEEIANLSICLFGHFELKAFFMYCAGADYMAKLNIFYNF